jgi:hypothetical protein
MNKKLISILFLTTVFIFTNKLFCYSNLAPIMVQNVTNKTVKIKIISKTESYPETTITLLKEYRYTPIINNATYLEIEKKKYPLPPKVLGSTEEFALITVSPFGIMEPEYLTTASQFYKSLIPVYSKTREKRHKPPSLEYFRDEHCVEKYLNPIYLTPRN